MSSSINVARPSPKKGSGGHSCLMTVLILFVVGLILAAGVGGIYLLSGRGGFSLSFGQAVGVIELEGVILDSRPVLETLAEYAENDRIKAVVLRINSPGGGVAPTQEIYQEIMRLRDKKKVVASMGTVAASGGLYVASAADVIMADPATVTGSIGVIMQMMNVEELMGKVGVKPVDNKSGKFKDTGSATRPMTEDEREYMQSVVDQLHHQFVRDLAKGREMDVEKVAELADGRIFTGEQALGLGLVDDLGNFRDALHRAALLGGITGEYREVYPPRRGSWWENLISGRSPINVLPEWLSQPVTFQYLYLPGA